MLKMNRSSSLLQYRALTLQSTTFWKKHFNRVTDKLLRNAIIQHNTLALHIGPFIPLSIESVIVAGENDFAPVIQNNFPLSMLANIESAHKLQELVFDIDLATDYDRFCSCIENNVEGGVVSKSICKDCWLHIEGTVIILRDILTERFGVDEKHILWVFSGCKGIHCIVNEKKMLKMDMDQRIALFNEIFVDKTDDYSYHTQNIQNMTYSKALIEELTSLFRVQVLQKRNLLSTSKSSKFEKFVLSKIRKYCGAGPTFLLTLQDNWSFIENDETVENSHKSVAKWQYLCQLEENNFREHLRPSLYIIFSLYYPMIDKAPLTQSNHTIKTPFSIHPLTHKISLPINFQLLMDYDVFESFVTLKTLVKTNITTADHKEEKIHPLFQEGKRIFDAWIENYNLST
jgi:DNA primase small subunit